MGVYVYTPLRERPCGAGVPLVPLTWLAPRESINRPSHHSDGKREEGEEREEGRKRKEGRGGGEKWGLKYGGPGSVRSPRMRGQVHPGASPQRIAYEKRAVPASNRQ